LSALPEVSREKQTNGWILALVPTIIDPEEVPRGLATLVHFETITPASRKEFV